MTLKEQPEEVTPKLCGLILAGGKSKRMGYDKSRIAWHGKEQRYYMADTLERFCENVFISCREEQRGEIDENYKTLFDTYPGLGPYGAILSAFSYMPGVAWLVVACDLPLVDDAAIKYLIKNRDSSAVATAFENQHNNLPEPLIAIWEPKSKDVLISFLSQGFTCPRKVLINSAVHVIKPLHNNALLNMNTPADVEHVKHILQIENAVTGGK